MKTPLTKKKILEMFKEIDDELAKVDLKSDLFIIGGAALTVVYDARPSTRDIDGIWQPTQPVRDIIKKLAGKHNLEDDWLNDAAKGSISHIRDEHPTVVYDGIHFSVTSPSPQYLLATKILASREGRDYDDIRFLIELCGFTTVDQCLSVVEKYFPNRPVVARSQFTVEEILASMKEE